jgi:hypothetical protein
MRDEYWQSRSRLRVFEFLGVDPEVSSRNKMSDAVAVSMLEVLDFGDEWSHERRLEVLSAVLAPFVHDKRRGLAL